MFRYKIGFDIINTTESIGITNSINVYENELIFLLVRHTICIIIEKVNISRLAARDILENTKESITFSLAV